MKKTWTVVILLILLSLSDLYARKKVAVVLSGGGAKGVAHIGALKVIEEAGIPIDFITGTSMGAIVGGLYALGYTAWQLDSMVNKQDWAFLLSDKIATDKQTFAQKEKNEKYLLSFPFSLKSKLSIGAGVINGQNLSNLFLELTIGYHNSMEFSKLPIPFACVSTNLVDGKQVVFHEGILPLAMRASMAIPAIFTPVRLDSMVLVDGGMSNNFPVNIAREMGADIVIGIDVQSTLLKADELNSATSILGQIIDLNCQNYYEQNKENTNVYIRPNVDNYSAASFTKQALDSMMINGERATREKWDELIALKKEVGVSVDFTPPKHGPFTPEYAKGKLYIQTITFNGLKSIDQKRMLHACGLKENSVISLSDLRKAVSIMEENESYTQVSYVLTDGPKYNLEFTLKRKTENTLNMGLRFETEEIAALLLNATLQFHKRIDSKLLLTGRLGQNLYARADYALETWNAGSFNLGYLFAYNDINIYKQGKRAYNTTYKYHSGELSFSDVLRKKMKYQLGARYEYFDYSSFLFSGEGEQMQVHPEGFFSYFASLNLETLDRWYFPTKGVSFKIVYSIYTDNMVSYKKQVPFSALSTRFSTVANLSNRFSLLPLFYGRVLIGRDIPYPYLNALGGNYFGKYVPQQLPFTSLNHLELANNSVVGLKLQFRQRIGKNNYVSLIGNYAVHNNDFFYLLKGKHIWGVGASYAYDSFFGPLEATLGFNTQSKKAGFYGSLGYVF